MIVPLAWLDEPSDVSVGVGGDLLVPCAARGRPQPTIEWLKLTAGGEETLGSQLKFHKISQHDAGRYECRASNGIDKGLSKQIELLVSGK